MLISNLNAVDEKKKAMPVEQQVNQDCDNASAELLNIIDFKMANCSPSPTHDELEVFANEKVPPEMFFSAESPIMSNNASLDQFKQNQISSAVEHV